MAGESRTNPTSLPPTPDGWRVMQIDELCERVTSGGTPSRQRPEFYQNGEFSWFKTGELKDCALYSSAEKITKAALESSSAKLFPPDTVLMAMYGDGTTITSLGILRREAATNQACCAMIPKSPVCDPLFLFYSLRNHREDFIHIASGGAQRNLSGNLIRRFAFNMPPLAEQKAIAQILGALDDKIELNRRMNATLEAMARALFQSWFVDFDPVRAKLDGRQPAGLDAATAALFPDHFQDSPLGHIPQGWEVKQLSELTTVITKGTTPTQEDMNTAPDTGTQINYIRVNSIDENGSILADKLTNIPEFVHAGVLKRSIIRANDVLYTIAGTIGRAATAEEWVLPANTNQAVAIIRPKPEVPPGFLVLTLWHEAFREQLHANIVHAVQANLSLGMLSKAQCVVPPATTLTKIFEPIENILAKINANRTQSRTLATLRDKLLPKLLSGELRPN